MVDIAEIKARYPQAVEFRFGDSQALCDAILALIRKGQKSMSCAALSSFGDDMPIVGRRDLALEWDGRPAMVIETVKVEHIRYCDMDSGRVSAQAEFRDLDHWREGYRAYLSRNGEFSEEMMLLCETYRMIEDFAS